MDFSSVFQWIEHTPIGTAIREGEDLFPWIETVHVLAITFVVGSIAAVDLRLLGLASRNRAFSRVNAEIVPLTWIAFVIAAISGALLFSAKAVEYANNFSFQLKFVLLALAGINMTIFQFVTFRRVADWDTAPSPPRAAKLAGAISLLTWVMIIACGRVIGFTVQGIMN